MNSIDIFAKQLLEEAKRFLELAKSQAEDTGEQANLHASLMLGFCALEAHVNSISEEFVSTNTSLSIHDKAVLMEKAVVLKDGQFVLTNERKITRLEDRIQFQHRRLSGKSIDPTSTWWTSLKNAIDLRNQLTHPKDATPVSYDRVSKSLQAIIDSIDALYLAIYGIGLPAAHRGLQSSLTF